MISDNKCVPSEEEVAAYKFFGKADKNMKAGMLKPAIGLFRQGVRMLKDVAGRQADVLTRFDIAETAAQIVFCKSSGGQAEGEMDGFMLR